MPKINWNALPHGVKKHLIDRVESRHISAQELIALQIWIDSGPELPDGDWYKDFGSFKLAGHGNKPATFLEKGMAAKGTEVQ